MAQQLDTFLTLDGTDGNQLHSNPAAYAILYAKDLS